MQQTLTGSQELMDEDIGHQRKAAREYLDNQGQLMTDMENLIKNHIDASSSLKEEIKKHKEMLDDIFASNEVYQNHSEAAKEAAQLKSQQKAEILKQPHAAELTEKIKEMRSELKDNNEALSDYLGEFKRISGLDEIETNDGKVLKIKASFKAVQMSLFN